MTNPVRLQLSRKRGFNLQALSMATNGLPAVKVTRPGPFGNPFPIRKSTSTHMGKTNDIWVIGTWEGPSMWFKDTKAEAAELSVQAYRAWIEHPARARLLAKVKQLRGKNLACWCPLDGSPCHADILIELSNAKQT